MKIHIFNSVFSDTQNFQPTANGMYPIYGQKGIIANIISGDSDWSIRLSKDYNADGQQNNTLVLQQYKIYTITSRKNNEEYKVVVTPEYFPKPNTYAIPEKITIGDNQACDIRLLNSISNKEYLTLSRSGERLIASTSSTNFFTQNHRIVNNEIIYCGDCIIFYGLKIIVLNNKIIVCTPKELIGIGSRLSQLPEEKPQLRPLDTVISVSEDEPLYTEKDFFQKPPRLNYVIETAEVKIDPPPQKQTMLEQPLILTLGPQITMIIASGLSMTMMIMMITGSTSANMNRMYFSIAAMVVTLIGSILWPTITRKIRKKQIQAKERKRQTKYLDYLKHKEQHLNFIRDNQKQTMLANNPSLTDCFKIVDQKDISLWQRNNSHDDFLNIRVGLGQVPTKLEINEPEEKFTLDDDDNLFLMFRQIIRDSKQLNDAPVCYNLTDKSIGAIAGNPELVKQFLDCVFAQILTFHSYSDLKIIVYTKEPEKWQYLKKAPHCWANDKSKRYFATTIDSFSSISTSIEKVFDARRENDEEVKKEDDGTDASPKTTYKDFHPYYLFFTDNIADLRSNSLISKILAYKRNLGFSILTTANTISTLPSETSDFVSITPKKSIVISGDTNKKELEFTPDLNNGKIDMDLFAQKVANIPVQVEKGKFELPKSLPFLELYNCGRVEQLNSLARWKNNNPYSTLSVPIGIDQNNEIFKMDIHEKAYGPHGLVAGTTGSGKSEWIITLILSLAVNFSPDEVQFVLIDYKGGGLAKSFENSDLKIKLPHLAGTITNLDKSDIFRSISAIESELKRRQALFNAAREKLKRGSMDIYSYQQCYRNGEVDQPLSHLLIICDEFAELKQQEPDFMEQLISTSRIGRSLGVHLILATQKPSGVVNDQIWSNSKFKVALKVQNRGDSTEIIKKPDAAYLKQTGSFYLQVGNDDYYNLGQVAWAGAKYYPSDNIKHIIDDSVQLINETGQIKSTFETTKETEKLEAQGEQLLNIVQYLSGIGEKYASKSPMMWLENVSPKIMLSDLKRRYNPEPAQKFNYRIAIGEYDEPRKQEQGLLSIDLAGGNIGIIGKADNSIEKLISTIVWSSICDHNPAEIAFYILDFGSETMKKFAKFPQVGEVIFQDETDKIAGMINLLNEELENRKNLLSDYNGSFEYYNKVSPQKLHLIEVIINNYDIFTEVIPKAAAMYAEFFRDAPKYGINFIVTANAQNTFGSRTQQYFNHMIVLQLADESMYRTITNCRKGLIPKKTVGRGICKLDALNTDSYCEFQTAFIDEEEKEIETIKKYADQCVEYYKCKVKQLMKIPEDITSEDLKQYVSDLTDTPIGINIYEKQLAKYNFQNRKVHLITGKNITQDMNFIYALTSILSASNNTKVHVVDLLGIFKKPILDIQILDQEKNAVFAALQKDVETRKESQDYGITIVVGAGTFKQVLNDNGQQAFRNIFSKIQNSKKTIYILIDNYESLRTLILEDWFKNVDKTSGIWLGQGIEAQSLLECNEIGTEDLKFNFPGLAFAIQNGQYVITKVVMDKD